MSNTSTIVSITDDTEIKHVFYGSTDEVRRGEIERTARQELRKGHTVVYPGGTRVHWERTKRFNPKASTVSERYEWNHKGNRVRADIIEFTIHPDGTEEQRNVQAVWVKY